MKKKHTQDIEKCISVHLLVLTLSAAGATVQSVLINCVTPGTGGCS